MKKLLLILALLIPALANAQGTQIVSGPTDPPTCDPNKGQLFKNTTSNTVETCSGVNTWTALGGAGGSISVNGSSVPSANFQDATNTQFNVAGSNVTISLLGVGLLSGNNTWTGSETHNGKEVFNADVFFKSGAPSYDVQAFGAACDGVTDDTAAITAAYNQLVADLAANGGNAGGGGAVHAPHAAHPCLVHTLTIPSSASKGWIVTDFDNGLIADTIVANNFNAFIGVTGNFQGLVGAFELGPMSTWVQATGNTGPLLDINGKNQIYIEGINLEGGVSNNTEVIHCHDNAGIGCIGVVMKRSMIFNGGSGKAWVADSSGNSQPTGFGYYFTNVGFETAGAPAYIATFTNTGLVRVTDSFVSSSGAGFLVKNAGIPSAGDAWFNNVYTENFASDLVSIDSTAAAVSDVVLRDMYPADSLVGFYFLKNTGTFTNNVIIDASFGNAINATTAIDPSSTANSIPLTCIGGGCDLIPLSTGAAALETYYGFPGNFRPAIFLQKGPTGALQDAAQFQSTTTNISGNPGALLSSVGINPTLGGVELGDSINNGYSGELYQPAKQQVALAIAQNMAPTSMAASIAAGGSLVNGTTYYYVVRSLLTGSSCGGAQSAWSKEVSATPSGGNLSVALTWVAGSGTISGYCVYRGTASNTESTEYFQTGGSSTGFTDTGAAGTVLAVGANINGTFPATAQVVFNLNGIVDNALTPTNAPICPNGTGGAFTTTGCTGSGGGPGTGTTNGIAYWNTATTLGSNTPPAVQGVYDCGYTVPSSSTVALTCPQLGLSGRALIGAATTDTVLFSDNATVIDHDKSASGAINETLPTATTLNNPSFVYSYANHSGQTDTITPTTWTIQAGTTAAGATLSVSPGTYCRIKDDPNSATNWLADCSSVGAVTSFSGDGLLLTNSSSTGAVTATVGSAPANKFWNGAWTQPAFSNLSGSATCAQMPAGTGDTTWNAGTCATTTSRINGTAFSGTNGAVVLFGVANIPVDSSILGANLVTQTSNAAALQFCTYTVSNKVCVPSNALPNGPTTATTQAVGDSSTDVANDAFVAAAVTAAAPIATISRYMAPAGLTTCGYAGAAGAGCTPSTNAATCGLTATTPCQDFSTVASVMAAYVDPTTKGIVTWNMADTGANSLPSGKCYQPNNVLFNVPGTAQDPDNVIFSVFNTETYPSSYIYFLGNATQSNVIISGATTCAGTTDSTQVGLVFDNSVVRFNGMKFQYFGSTVRPWFAANAIEGVRSVIYLENATGLGDGTNWGSMIAGWDHSVIKMGGTFTVTNEAIFAVSDHSTLYTTDPLNTSSANTSMTYSANASGNGNYATFAYLQSHVNEDRFTLSASGTGSYVFWSASASSLIWYAEVYSAAQCQGGECQNLTFNAANATYMKADENSYIDLPCVSAVQEVCTVTALGVMAEADAMGIAREIGALAATNPDVVNGGIIMKGTTANPDTSFDWHARTLSGATQFGIYSNGGTNSFICQIDCTTTNYYNTAAGGGYFAAQTAAASGYPYQSYKLGAGQENWVNAVYSNTNATDQGQYFFVRSRGTTAGSHGAILAGDSIGSFLAVGDDGTATGGAGSVQFFSDLNWDGTHHPGRVSLYTVGNNVSGQKERWRVDSSGNFTAEQTGQTITSPLYATSTNCSSSASPAVCAASAAGSVAMPTNAVSSSIVVNTTAVTANSQIFVQVDDTLGTKLSVTCNSTAATLVGGIAITARTAGTSFTISNNVAIVTNPLCISYYIVN